jgi:hypothetical protein
MRFELNILVWTSHQVGKSMRQRISTDELSLAVESVSAACMLPAGNPGGSHVKSTRPAQIVHSGSAYSL